MAGRKKDYVWQDVTLTEDDKASCKNIHLGKMKKKSNWKFMQSDSNFRTGECSILLIEIWYCRAFLQNCRNIGQSLLNCRNLLTELLTVKLLLLSFRSVGLFSLNYHILRYLHRTVGLILDERSIEHFLENTHFAGKTENS